MNMKKLILIFIAFALVAISCKTTKDVTDNTQVINLDTLSVSAIPTRPVYNPSKTRYHDLLHTKLDVRFNWEKQQLYGKAWLTLKPYFFSTNHVKLDAKGFDIQKVALVEGDKKTDLKYDYDNLFLDVKLDKEYTKNDKYTLYIEYTAKPEELEEGGSSAITSDKGLYFINHDGSDPKKPQQIWTQGETEASSCWFPTIDAPNERCTQEIYITVQNKFKTLSNGTLQFSEMNEDGTRTDYWKMDKPHAPYLFMMAIGDFAITKDKWKNIDVDYYVEHEYAPYAKDIFGKTPKMIEFYSNVLGVQYPWSKYHQVVVRDYVSGAMENTSAVIHGEFLHATKRELIDSDNEDIIAHELFHHWFGDLVTCESWANLPLNESFATYGEYLWREFEHGRDAADEHGQTQQNQYLQESLRKQEDMIRFDYANKEDMFDSHSYAKGGRILHMLRKYVGDDAFFASLKLYLEKNAYTDVEMHELRLAFEEVTGEDLNWFFNQWFYSSGHPDLEIEYSYDPTVNKQFVFVTQKQKFETTPIYKLPVSIDIYCDGKLFKRHDVVIDKVNQEFEFEVPSQPSLVNFDAEKMLLCEKKDEHTKEEWAFMYHNAPLYLDRYEALSELSSNSDSLSTSIVVAALNDKYWDLKRTATNKIRKAVKSNKEEVKEKLIEMALNDKKSLVRSSAINALGKYYKDDDISPLFEKTIKDSSYAVIASTLTAYEKVDSKKAMDLAKSMESEENESILLAIASIYELNGGKEENEFFISAFDKIGAYTKFVYTQSYARYLKKQDNETVEKGLPILKDVAANSSAWWMRLSGIQALNDLQSKYSLKEASLKEELDAMKAGDDGELEKRNELKSTTALKEKIDAVLEELKTNETNENLKRFLGVVEE